MAWPVQLIGKPLTIEGQTIKVRDPQRALSHSYVVPQMYGKPLTAQWYGEWVHFTTDKGKSLLTNCGSLKEA